MADETEKFLLDKFRDSLDPKLRLHAQFSGLQELLRSKLSQSLPEDVSNLCREKLFQLSNLLMDYKKLSSKRSLYSPDDLWFIYNLGKRLKKIKQEISGAAGASSSRAVTPPPITGHPISAGRLEVFRWSSPLVDQTKVYGLDDEARYIERLLLQEENGEEDEHFKAIGIVGMEGIGKTTLCQVVFNDEEVKNRFVPRIWVCMSKGPKEDADSKIEIVKRMLRCLGVEDEMIKSAEDGQGLGGLVFALHLQLKGKRYLIVLDDAWNIEDDDPFFADLGCSRTHQGQKWSEKLGYGLPKGHMGSVIVTSRSEKKAMDMVGERQLHQMLPTTSSLGRERCWMIFKNTVQEDGAGWTPDLDNLKHDILNKSGALPKAAKIMGQIMKKQQLQNNSNANQNHQQPP